MIPDPKRIAVVGDLHGNHVWAPRIVEHVASNGCDVIVQVGDYGLWTDGPGLKLFQRRLHEALVKHDVTLYWLDGNHEDFNNIHSRLKGREAQPLYKAFPRIVHLPRGFRWEWWGKTWMALGGAASVDRLARTPGKSWWPGELLSDEDVEFASRPGGVDVIVSHDCPYGVDIPKIGIGTPNADSDWPYVTLVESGEHRRRVRDVVEATRPTLIVHGHYHLRYQAFYQYGDGSRCLVQGLDCDGSDYARGCLFLSKP
ncbi:hypothetical protein SEA_HOKKEND_146 [Mycobacterium phage HokkenD]|uniref:Metallophosphoesterase n=2 Tax=Omegavirus courthouse TaxID=1089119 RepID=G8I5K3_9CAUD|nr:metallo-phosphoesterase [Mycobacterium phage Courthouse]YP_009205280.1 metallo-phosphoesterase [Mycobacterium phage Ariel]ASZ74219.1 metallophosphoesterase [Mycobacterium phage Squint]ATS92989.1 metallophosphoesterase [Mycobacterium phage Superphikiman]QDM55732.1 hypothetical protein SEA_HOKKEND_146 [Mycobacterium phage HokkenD]QGJ93786.1 metallophosphoesterase [Mycobacterium phage Hannaconda]QPO16755.1 metallophosphoesterase [Mycobacterium phage KashFlow]